MVPGLDAVLTVRLLHLMISPLTYSYSSWCHHLSPLGRVSVHSLQVCHCPLSFLNSKMLQPRLQCCNQDVAILQAQLVINWEAWLVITRLAVASFLKRRCGQTTSAWLRFSRCKPWRESSAVTMDLGMDMNGTMCMLPTMSMPGMEVTHHRVPICRVADSIRPSRSLSLQMFFHFNSCERLLFYTWTITNAGGRRQLYTLVCGVFVLANESFQKEPVMFWWLYKNHFFRNRSWFPY